MTLRPGSPEFLSAIDQYVQRDADRFYWDEAVSCRDPGPYGCGSCDACCEIAERAMDAAEDR